MLRKVAVIFTSVVLLAAANAKALGLGEVTLDSALNQPLVARIELLQLDGVALDQIQVQMASADDFARLAIDRLAFLDNIQLSVGSAGADAYIALSSAQAMPESSLRFVLETRWPAGRLLSEYNIRLQQPAFGDGAAAAIQQPISGGFSAQNISINQQNTAQNSSDLLNAGGLGTGAANEPPQRLAATDPADAITVGDNDTLWNIALSVRPDSSVSVQQTMLALQRLNREAFIADNINMVRSGQVLRIPDLAEISAVGAREAISEVSRQNQLFDNRRNVPLTAQPLTAQPDPGANAALNRGELRVVTSDDSAIDTNAVDSASGTRSAEFDSRISGLEDQLAVQAEEVDRVSLQNQELSERLSMLEQQIASAREIIRLRDLELAQLQQALATAEPDTETNAATTGSNATEPTASAPVVTMAPEPSLPQRLLDSVIANTYLLLGVACLVVLLLVFALLRRNKSVEEEEPLAGSADSSDILNIDETAATDNHEEMEAFTAISNEKNSAEDAVAISPDPADPVPVEQTEQVEQVEQVEHAEAGDAIVEAVPPAADLAAPAPVDDYDDLQFLDIEVSDEDLATELEEEEELSFLSGIDEAATKLDLARAYIEMGDQDGAREILEEVVTEGSEAQIEDARTLLSKL